MDLDSFACPSYDEHLSEFLSCEDIEQEPTAEDIQELDTYLESVLEGAPEQEEEEEEYGFGEEESDPDAERFESLSEFWTGDDE